MDKEVFPLAWQSSKVPQLNWKMRPRHFIHFFRRSCQTFITESAPSDSHMGFITSNVDFPVLTLGFYAVYFYFNSPFSDFIADVNIYFARVEIISGGKNRFFHHLCSAITVRIVLLRSVCQLLPSTPKPFLPKQSLSYRSKLIIYNLVLRPAPF